MATPKILKFNHGSILSNFYYCVNPIVLADKKGWKSNYTEVLFQAAKFDYIPEQDYGSVFLYRIKKDILATNNPTDARNISFNKRIVNCVDPKWRSRNVGLMRKLIRAKFESNKEEVTKALGTDETLVEDSIDEFWSCGETGTGQNMLGKLWMELRTEIRKC